MQKYVTAKVAKSPKNKDVLVFRASTMGVDRDGDVLVPDGIVVEHYMKNPVVLWAHDWHSRLPIGKALNVEVVPQSHVEISVEFDAGDPFAMDVKRKYENGFLNAVSVGFEPIEAEEILKDNGRTSGYRFNKWELMELSGVPIPANSDALMLGYKGWMNKKGLEPEEAMEKEAEEKQEELGAEFKEGEQGGQQQPSAMELLQQVHAMVSSLVSQTEKGETSEQHEEASAESGEADEEAQEESQPEAQAASANEEDAYTKALEELGLTEEQALDLLEKSKKSETPVEDVAKKAIIERVAYLSGKSWTTRN